MILIINKIRDIRVYTVRPMKTVMALTAPTAVSRRQSPGGQSRPGLLLLSVAAHVLALVGLAGGTAPTLPEPAATRTIQVSWVARQTPVLQSVAPAQRPQPLAHMVQAAEAMPEAAPRPEKAPATPAEPASEPVPEQEAIRRTAPEPVTSNPVFDAAYLQNPPPVYPRAALRLREEGDVALRVRVGADGRPREIILRRSSGSARLDRAAQDAVERWQFIAARRAGMAVAAWVVVPITFKLENR